MKIRTNFKPALAASMFLLTASQMNLVQAADNTGYYQAAQPVIQGYGAPQMQQPQAGQGYGYVPTDNLTPGYTQPYYQGGNQGRNQGRDYGRGYNSSPWGGSGPSFSGPWDSGRGNSMPWSSGPGGNSMPWSSGSGGNGPSFSGPWDSKRGSGMPW